MNVQENILDPESSKVCSHVLTLMVNAGIARELAIPMAYLQCQFHLWRVWPHDRISYQLRGPLCAFYTSIFPPQVLITETNYSDLMFCSEKKSRYSQFGKKQAICAQNCHQVWHLMSYSWNACTSFKNILSSYFLIHDIQIEEFWHHT